MRPYPGSMDKDKSYISAYRGTERAESGNHAPELSEMTVIIGVKMGKSGLKWCEGRNYKGKRIKAENGLLKRGEDRENRPLYFGECRGGVLVR